MTEINRIEERMRLQHKIYSTLIKDSNAKWPHPEKIQTLQDMREYWFSSLLAEKYFSYCIFYDRSPVEIMEMSDDKIVAELQDKVIKYCEKTNIDLIRISHAFAGKYYIQPFIHMANDYKVKLDMDECGQGALVPRNFFLVLDKFRGLYARLNREVKGELGEIEYFTDDLSGIVISYLY